MKLFVVVSMGGGVINDVFIRGTEPEAEELFKALTGITYKEYSDRRNKDEDPEEILGDDYDGTQIYEIEVEIPLIREFYHDVERYLSHALQPEIGGQERHKEVTTARDNLRKLMRRMGWKGEF